MDAERAVVLDSVATEYEDSFCLESFGDLIKAAAEAEGGGFHATPRHARATVHTLV